MTFASNTATYGVLLDTSAEHVWAVVRSFARVADWHPIAKASRLVTGRDGEPGSERELTYRWQRGARTPRRDRRDRAAAGLFHGHVPDPCHGAGERDPGRYGRDAFPVAGHLLSHFH